MESIRESNSNRYFLDDRHQSNRLEAYYRVLVENNMDNAKEITMGVINRIEHVSGVGYELTVGKNKSIATDENTFMNALIEYSKATLSLVGTDLQSDLTYIQNFIRSNNLEMSNQLLKNKADLEALGEYHTLITEMSEEAYNITRNNRELLDKIDKIKDENLKLRVYLDLLGYRI